MVMNVNTEDSEYLQQRGKRIMLILLVISLLPLLGGYWLVASGWRPSTTGNYGELVQPARPIADIRLKTLDGTAMQLGELRHKWLMIVFAPADCPGVCEDNLYKMRQIHIALAKNQKRVQRLFIITAPGDMAGLTRRLRDYPDLLVATGSAETIQTLSEAFRLPSGAPLEDQGRVYIMDTIGNLMMSYPSGAEAKGILKDMQRLLRASQIG